MIGAALTAGVSGVFGAATASAAPACSPALLSNSVPTTSLIGDSGAGAVTQALLQANAAPGVLGLDPLVAFNTFITPILANPLTLVFTAGIQLKGRRIRRRLRHVKRTVSDQYLFAQRPIEYVVFGVILAVAVALVAYLAMWPHA